MKYQDGWEPEWLAKKLSAGEPAWEAHTDGNGAIVVRRGGRSESLVVPIDVETIDAEIVEECLRCHAQPDFLVHMKPGCRVEGAALEAAKDHMAIGSVADLYRALRYDDQISEHQIKEVAFIEQGLGQFRLASRMTIVDRRRYELFGPTGSSLTVFVSSDYELTAAALRDAVERYSPFDVLALANPNAQRPSQQTLHVAGDVAIEVVFWGEFFEMLRAKWS